MMAGQSCTFANGRAVLVEWRDDSQHASVFKNRLEMVLHLVENSALGSQQWGDEDHLKALEQVRLAVDRAVERVRCPPKKTCNLHDDCEAADQRGQLEGYRVHHCWDEECEDCFGR